ncbi:MAG: peptide chain release factor N(5)-glutamine methyltransferase [Chloroflexi bacterium]|nr:peptide chain release factor N(5)-glutamine methyltransferase [Chloroflexota bacterium]
MGDTCGVIDKDNSLRAAITSTTLRLRAAGIDTAALDARLLVRAVTGLDDAGLLLALDRSLDTSVASQLASLVERRENREPIAYILGEREFYGLTFLVGPEVLIPRPETELLVERAIELAPRRALCADVGTGSGAIACTLATYRSDVIIQACDVSPTACRAAQRNAARLGVDARVGVVRAGLLSACALETAVVLANLPYLTFAEMEYLQPEVRREPILALSGGVDGLVLYRRLIEQLAAIRPAVLLLEAGPDQVEALAALVLRRLQSYRITVYRDLAQLPRVVEGVCATPAGGTE